MGARTVAMALMLLGCGGSSGEGPGSGGTAGAGNTGGGETPSGAAIAGTQDNGATAAAPDGNAGAGSAVATGGARADAGSDGARPQAGAASASSAGEGSPGAPACDGQVDVCHACPDGSCGVVRCEGDAMMVECPQLAAQELCALCCLGGEGHPACASADCDCAPDAGTGGADAGSGGASPAHDCSDCDVVCGLADTSPCGESYAACECDSRDRVRDGCTIGGCSSQLCGDGPGPATTCEWRPAYGCYRTAICERQANQRCAWTRTEALQACLDSVRAR